jgi:tetratricopeptide (TPR) repeat protein
VLAKTLIRLADCLCGIGFSQETETDDTSLLQEMSKLLNPRYRLRERRRNKEARDLYYRGLKVQQRLANQDPEIYEYDYVVGLNNLAALHYRMGDAEQALTIYTFALSAYGRDTLKDPDTFAPIIAELMHGIAVCTEKVGREHDAAQWREDERRMRDAFGL